MLMCIFALCTTNSLFAQSPPPWQHPLNLDNNNYWQKRIPITITNVSAKDFAGEYAYVQIDFNNFIPECDVKEIRICMENGMELRYAVYTENLKYKRQGLLTVDDYLAIPLGILGVSESETYYLYYGNKSAGIVSEPELSKVLTNSDTGITILDPSFYSISFGLSVENKLKSSGINDTWPYYFQSLWDYRIPVKVYNFTATEKNNFPVVVNLSRLQHQFGSSFNRQSLRFMENDSTAFLDFYQLEQYTVFFTDIPANTEKTIYVYFSTKEGISGSEEKTYMDLLDVISNPLEQSHNLNFENNDPLLIGDPAEIFNMPKYWNYIYPSTIDKLNDLGKILDLPLDKNGYKNNCVNMTISANNHSDSWGWYQNLPADSGVYYLFAGMAKGSVDGVLYTEPISYTLLYLNENNEPCAYKNVEYISSSMYDKSDGWQIAARLIGMPTDIKNMKIIAERLIKNNTSKIILKHDEILFTQVTCGYPGKLEGNVSRLSFPVLWEENSIRKIFPDTVPLTSDIPDFINIQAAKNEKEIIQIALRSDIPLELVRFSFDGFTLNQKPVPSPPTLAIDLVEYVPVDYNTGFFIRGILEPWFRLSPGNSDGAIVPPTLTDNVNDGWIGLWPDQLKPYSLRNPFKINANKTKAFYIIVTVPKDAGPGDYQGTLKVSYNGGELIKSLQLKVLDYELPDETSLISIFDINFFHRGDYLKSIGFNDKEKFYLSLFDLLKEYRMSPDRTPSQPIFDYTGTNSYDQYFTEMNQYFGENNFNFPVSYAPWQFYLGGYGFDEDNIYDYYFNVPSFENKEVSSIFKKAYSDSLLEYWQAIDSDWKDKIWLYLMDEPMLKSKRQPELAITTQKTIIAFSEIINDVEIQLGENIPTYASTRYYVNGLDPIIKQQLIDAIDIWGLRHYSLVSQEILTELKIDHGKDLLYTMDDQYSIDTPLLATERVLPYLCFKYGVLGFEYFSLHMALNDPVLFSSCPITLHEPIDDPRWYGNWGNGNGYIVYPNEVSASGEYSWFSSIRLEQLREGIEDFEHMNLLRILTEHSLDAALKSRGESMIKSIQGLISIPQLNGQNSTSFVQDPEEILLQRDNMQLLIESLYTSYAAWINGTEYLKDDFVTYQGMLWQCLSNHTAQAQLNPADQNGSVWISISE